MWQNWKPYCLAAERIVEEFIFASRWFLAPFYAGLAISLIVLLIKFLEELFHLAMHAFVSNESQVILGVLSLVDMALTGSLLIIVIFSGYENFVSRIDHEGHKDWPQWMGTIDFSALKLKLLSSIVAISAIQLLKQFMAIREVTDRDLYFLIAIHVVFVISSVLLALADRIAGHDSHGHHMPLSPYEPPKQDVQHGMQDHEPKHDPAPPAAPMPPKFERPAEIQVASAEPVYAVHSQVAQHEPAARHASVAADKPAVSPDPASRHEPVAPAPAPGSSKPGAPRDGRKGQR